MKELKLLKSGSGWIAIEKPEGLSVHNEPGSDVISRVHQIIRGNKDLATRTKWDSTFEPAPVHRLDLATSGVMILTTNKNATTYFHNAFAERNLQKIYWAVVKGDLPETGEWNFPLTEKAEGRVNPAGSGPKKPCHTRFRCLQKNRYLSFIEVDLGSGRQHQIRRHAALSKHPVVGDRRYGKPEYADLIREKFGFDRLALHAGRLVFKDLENHEITVESPVPDDFRRLVSES